MFGNDFDLNNLRCDLPESYPNLCPADSRIHHSCCSLKFDRSLIDMPEIAEYPSNSIQCYDAPTGIVLVKKG